MEKQPINIERENLEILVLGFDIPMQVMGFEEIKMEGETENEGKSRLIRYFEKGNLRFGYEIRMSAQREYYFTWEVCDKTKKLPTDYNAQIAQSPMAQIVQGLSSRQGFAKSFESCIDYIAEQGAIIRQKIENKVEEIAV